MSTLNIVVSPKVLFNPTVNAGPDRQITLPTDSLIITASASDDEAVVSYQWVQISGPVVSLGGANTASLSLSGLPAGNYTFQITVTDNDGLTGTDSVNVQVITPNQLPVAEAGNNQLVDISIYDAQLDPTYDVNLVSGNIYRYKLSANAIQNIKNLFDSGGQNGVEIKLRQLDGGDTNFYVGLISTIDVSNRLLTISFTGAPNPTTATRFNTGLQSGLEMVYRNLHTIINGSASSDSDGTIVNYNWSVPNGPNIPILNTPNTVSTLVRGLVAGVYTVNLEVTDNNGGKDTDSLTLTVIDDAAQNAPKLIKLGPLLDTGDIEIGPINGSAIDTDGHSLPWKIPVTISDVDNHNVDIQLVIKTTGGSIIYSSTQSIANGKGISTFNIPGPILVGSNSTNSATYIVEVNLTDADGVITSTQSQLKLYDSSNDVASIRVISSVDNNCYSEKVVEVTIPPSQTRVVEWSITGPTSFVTITPSAGTINTTTQYTMRIDASNQGTINNGNVISFRVKNNNQIEDTESLARNHTGNVC